MTSPYREDDATLRARAAALRDEIAELDRKMGEALHWGASRARSAAELRALEAALAGRAAPRTRLPLAGALDRIEVASPCPASWDAMIGDARERFCGACEKTVYDLSQLTRSEAEAFLAARLPTGEVCVRFYRRADGRVLTSDCPEGRKWKRRKRALAAVAGGAGMALAGAGLTAFGLGRRALLRAETGAPTVVTTEVAAPPPVDTSLRPTSPLPPDVHPVAPPPRLRPEGFRVGRLPAHTLGKPSRDAL